MVMLETVVRLIAEMTHPVGSLYFNATDSTNPGTLLGFGTWEAFGAGRVLVGLDSGDTAFDTVEKTGGVKEVTLTSAQSGLPAHTHIQNAHSHTSLSSRVRSGTSGILDGASGSTFSFDTDQGTAEATATNQNNTAANASSAHTNLQPYIVVYIWKRTA